MKNLKLYFLALTLGVATLTSCSSDDNSPEPQPQPQNELLGKWDLEKVDMKMIIDGEVTIDEKDVPIKQAGLISQYEFFADNTVEYYIYNPAIGNNPATEESGEGTYIRNNDQLTLTINSGNTFTIKLLDAENLHLQTKQDENVEGVVYSLDMTQKFVKMK